MFVVANRVFVTSLRQQGKNRAMKNIFQYITFTLILSANQALAESSVWDKSTETYTGKKDITVYRDANCGCCKDWIKHLKKHEFNIIDRISKNMPGIKQQYGVPRNLASCHTAIIDGYVIEGHVPADDIKRLLNSKLNIAGLSVPKMPVGTPGMERRKKKDPFIVIKFNKSGEFDSFKEYWSY